MFTQNLEYFHTSSLIDCSDDSFICVVRTYAWVRMTLMFTKLKLIKIVASGTGSRRITIPKDMVGEIFKRTEYASIKKSVDSLRD